MGDSGKNFRIERRAYPVGPYMILRQATEVNGTISFVFYIKVDNDPGSKPIPVQSRDYIASSVGPGCHVRPHTEDEIVFGASLELCSLYSSSFKICLCWNL